MGSVAETSVEVVPVGGALTELAAIIARVGYDTPFVDLFENDVTPTPASVLADFTIPTYVGYTQGHVTGWGTPHVNADGTRANVDATTVIAFAGPAAGGGPTVYGYLLRDDTAATNPLWRAYRFSSPISLLNATNVVSIVPSVTNPNRQ